MTCNTTNPQIDPRQEWATPDDFWRVIDAEFEFQLDAAATAGNAKCTAYYGPDRVMPDQRDGLSARWVFRDISERVYCNPGFLHMRPWVEKNYIESQRHTNALCAMMGPLSNARWMHFCRQNAVEIRHLYPRPQFVPAPGVPHSTNAKDNVIVIFRRVPHGWPGAKEWTWHWAEART